MLGRSALGVGEVDFKDIADAGPYLEQQPAPTLDDFGAGTACRKRSRPFDPQFARLRVV